MKNFHISDVLSVTTGRYVSTRHIEGIYDILNFLTSDNLFTHQLMRASEEAKPWLRTQFPQLMDDDPIIIEQEEILDKAIAEADGEFKTAQLQLACEQFVNNIRERHGLPEMLPVYEMGADMHLQIDPIEELSAMVGDDKIIAIEVDE